QVELHTRRRGRRARAERASGRGPAARERWTRAAERRLMRIGEAAGGRASHSRDPLALRPRPHEHRPCRKRSEDLSMSDVFYLRSIDPPITPEDVVLTADAGGCFDMHRVTWKQSFLSADGARMLCWYEAPDTESARIALRQLQANLEGVWPGTVAG